MAKTKRSKKTKLREQDVLALLEELSNADAVPGREDEVRDIFIDRWKDIGGFRFDRLGSIIAEVAGAETSGPRLAIESHLDEVGFMVRLITRKGLLKLAPLGGFWSQALPATRLRILLGGRKIPAIIGAMPPHLLGKDRDKSTDVKDLLVDVGAASREEVEGLGIRPGCFAVPDSVFTALVSGSRVAGKAFDNRVGCAVAIRALLRAAELRSEGTPLPCTVVGMGSVQEEVGLRGVQTAAEVASPDVAIVVEGSPADDLALSNDESQGRLGGGVQIRAFDPTMVASPRLVELALEVCAERGIPHQLAVRTSGGTDAGRLHLHARGVPTIVVAVPVRYAHSHVGVIDVADLEAMEALVWALMEGLSSKTIQERLLPWSNK